ncbi:NAD(+) diphosphatase [Undibacterium sp. TJN25]|uniref:NAD(+) diphosphatase n=1 Tax=Undibacterium sp. TJN25 TaxID=3413056 RepID=UPI003BF2FAA5
MLKTPDQFQLLLHPQQSENPLSFIFRGDELLVRSSDLSLPDLETFTLLDIDDSHIHPLGLLNQRYCRTAWTAKNAEAPQGYVFTKLRPLFGEMDDDLLGLAGRAFQIAEWARSHQYCGTCATPMTLARGERCYKCPACGMVAYPRISPAMMVLIKKGEHILLAKHTASPTTRYVPLAGFLEAGESIEEAIHREVFEEVGLHVKNLQYFGSQSWPFPHSLMIAFTAEYVSGNIVLDESEIADAQWFGPGNPIPDYPIGVSVSGALVDAHRPKNLL